MHFTVQYNMLNNIAVLFSDSNWWSKIISLCSNYRISVGPP